MGHFHVHRTYFLTLAAADALLFLYTDAEKRKIACRLQENGNGTDVFAKRSVVFAAVCEDDPDGIVEDIAKDKTPPHDILFMRDLKSKQQNDKYERSGKNKVADHAPAPARGSRFLEREQIQNHRSPAGIAAPPTPKDQRAKNFCNGIMNGRRFKYAEEKIVPKSFDLHIFPAKNPQVDEHIHADCKLDYIPGIFFLLLIQDQPCSDCSGDIGEVEQLE